MYDLVIAGGRVIDPAQGLDGRYDVAFAGGKVAAVAQGIDPALAAGWGVYAVDMQTDTEGDLDRTPSPDDLWNRTFTGSLFDRIIEIKEREPKRVEIFVFQIDQPEKTLVFSGFQRSLSVESAA